jgi:hypothetical protein
MAWCNAAKISKSGELDQVVNLYITRDWNRKFYADPSRMISFNLFPLQE